MCKRMVYDFENPGEVKIITVDHCSYAWSGTIPFSGVYRCVYCGKLPEHGNELELCSN